MSRAELIENIIAQRKPYADDVRRVRTNLESLRAALSGMRVRTQRALNEKAFGGKLEPIHHELTDLEKRAAERLERLDALKSRYERGTLNIAVIGLARMGKSLMLRSISSLGPHVIPDGAGEPCTGVRSTICHHPNVTEARGNVQFHSEQSLLNIIHLYYRDLGFAEPYPQTLNEFFQDKRQLPSYLSSDPLRKQRLEDLNRYRQHLTPDLVEYILEEACISVPEDQIIHWVTQRLPNPDDPDGKPREIYNYLAVRDVQIICKFPYDNVGKIALIDLPGLGETALGASENLIQALRYDADIALFVVRPKPDQFKETPFFELYGTAENALKGDLRLEQWAFLVINHEDSERLNNIRDCENFSEQIEGSPLKFFGKVICDCSQEEETREKILDTVLTHMEENIRGLDRQFTRSCAEDILQLHQETESVLKLARDAFKDTDDLLEEERSLDECFQTTWDDLRKGLTDLLRDLEANCEGTDGKFNGKVQDVIARYQKMPGLPTEAEAQKSRDSYRSYPEAWSRYVKEIRADLSNRLGSLDTAMDASLDETKARVAGVFREQGHFKFLVGEQDGLMDIAKVISSDHSEIWEAFSRLSDFQISGRGVIGYKVRRELNRLLEPDRVPMASREDYNAKFMVEDLTKRVNETIEAIQKSLAEEEFRKPNQCAYAIVADFIDAIVFARGMEAEWKRFYRMDKVKARVWADSFKERMENRRIRQEWLKLLEQVEYANQPDRLAFAL